MWRSRLRKYVYVAGLVLFWPAVALIVWGELTPNPPDVPVLDVWDKLEHFTAYFGLAAMVGVVLGSRRVLIWALVGLAALGGMLEIIQGFTGRDADIFDEIANVTGVLCGAGAAYVLLALLKPRPLVDVRPDE